MGNQRQGENTTPEQSEFLRLFPGLSACLDSLAKDLDDADATCKEQLEDDQRIPILVPTLDKESSVILASVREAMLRSSNPGDATVAAAKKIIESYRDTAGTAAISCFDKMLSVAQGAGTVHTVAPSLAQEVRSHLSGRWEPANVLRLISLGGVLPPAFSPDDNDVDTYVKNQIRGPVLSRFDSHVQRVLNDATVEEAKANAMADNPAATKQRARLGLGEWAENRLREAQSFARLTRGGRSPQGLRGEFPVLFADVIDRLPQLRQERFLEECTRRLMTVPSLMAYIADVKNLKGDALNEYREDYRRQAGIARKRQRAS